MGSGLGVVACGRRHRVNNRNINDPVIYLQSLCGRLPGRIRFGAENARPSLNAIQTSKNYHAQNIVKSHIFIRQTV